MSEPSNQRWLSFDGICTTLQISHRHATWLAKQGFLVVIWGDKGKQIKQARFLDPTPEYAAKLKACEALYGRLYPIPIDLNLTPLLSLREVAQIMGWSLKTARTKAHRRLIPDGIKVGKYYLYSIETVRDLLWRKSGRKMAKQRAPFLIEDMIRFFMACYEDANREVPLDTAFANDDLLQRKFARLAKMKSPEKEAAMRELWEKVEMAKTVAAALV